MANSTIQVMRALPGVLSAALVLILTLGTLVAVFVRADFAGDLGPADWAAIRFTISQALVSAGLSVVLAIPVARALARRQFRGRGVLITLLGAPFLLPVIVAVLGLLAVFGRGGLVNDALGLIGISPISIYGFHGVVLAHVFFNLPLATRLILQGWLSIPAERFRLTATLDASVWHLLERPMLRAIAPGVFLVIFLICLTSFAVALTLGGGPRATTVELAIYQALRFDFDLGRAAMLAAIQFGLCAAAAAFVWQITGRDSLSGGLDRTIQRWNRPPAIIDAVFIGCAALFLLLPMAMIVIRGLPGLGDLPVSIWPAAFRSVSVAIGSAALCATMATALAISNNRLTTFVGVLPLAASGLVIGTGAFLIVHPFMNPAMLALPITALVNATLALPFVLRAIAPAVAEVRQDYDRLSATMGLNSWTWVTIVLLPRIRRPLGFGAGIAAALSMGDLGVITLFAGEAQATLPLAMYRLMGAYQMEAAASAALLLVALSFALFWICDRGGRTNAPL